MTIRLALADDHTLLRDALAQLLDTQEDVEIVGVAGDAMSTIEMVRSRDIDVLILDVDMPGPGVLPTVRTLRKIAPRLSLLMLSMYDDPAIIRALLALGIRGYMLKSASHAELLAAVRRVKADPSHLVLSVTERLFEPTLDADTEMLTDREKEVIGLAAAAYSNGQIASRLGLQESTVKRHMHNIFGKLGAVSRMDAVNKAVSSGQLARPDSDEPQSGVRLDHQRTGWIPT